MNASATKLVKIISSKVRDKKVYLINNPKKVHALNSIALTTASITPLISNKILITLEQLTTNDSVKWAHPI
jgi:hypothetical protein